MESAREAPNVMVVDDELGFRDLMKFELTPRGYKIITAADGEEALAKARSANVSVVISDMTMPKLGGLDLLAALKACDPAIEVIIVTGFATVEIEIECKSRGAFELITKPFQIDDIVHLIDCALEKHRVGRAAARENGVRR